MALVDYSSDSGSEAEDQPETASAVGGAEPAGAGRRPCLPPLPPSFHDLYASTVRASARDDPSLHQGRVRQIPHVAGNWPSHVYIEWFPTQDESDKLGSLLEHLRAELGQGGGGGEAEDLLGGRLHSFLASDLGTPLPLHISLSRPFVLMTEEKDGFLRRLTAAVEAQGAVSRFLVCPSALSWHKSPDSNRAFLVLRVHEDTSQGKNPGLAALLSKCNALVKQFDQPPLYASSDDGGAPPDDKFHVSIAWSFADVTEELRARTTAVYGRPGHQDQVRAMQIPVGSVKVKIGNVVTSLALPYGRQRPPAKQTLFGI